MDPIVDLLIRIKNAYLARHKSLEVPPSRQKGRLVKILVDSGYLQQAKIIKDKKREVLQVDLRYDKRRPAVTGLKVISKAGLRIYTSSRKIRKVLGGVGISIVSTSKGLMTGKEAKTKNLGGELICQIW